MTKKKFAGWLGVLAAAAAAIVASQQGGKRPPLPIDHTPEWQQTCRTVMLERRAREISAEELAGCVEVARRGGQVEQLREFVDALPPDPVVTPPAPVLERVHVDGRFFVTNAGTFRPVFASELSILRRSADERAALLEQDAALGFNGIRVFAGALTWANQTPQDARGILPELLEQAAARGLYVYVSAITDSATGYDVEAHLRQVAAICEAHANCLLQIANEPYHATQSRLVQDPAQLLALARRAVPAGLPYDLGPATADEPDLFGRYPFDGGAFNSAHLDRGRDKWNQVRRLREIAAISDATRKPAMSGEPIGAAEAAIPGKRESDPAFFFAMGALCRGFELGCVFHSQAGLDAVPLGPVQRDCAAAFLAGWRAIPSTDRLAFQNAGWASSPVASADFSRVVRAYTFQSGDRAWTVLVGLAGDPRLELRVGWRVTQGIDERAGVRILELAR